MGSEWVYCYSSANANTEATYYFKKKKLSFARTNGDKALSDRKKSIKNRFIWTKKDQWCGPASLQMVLKYVTGKKVSQKKLHKACTGNKKNTPVDFFQMKKAAKKKKVSACIYNKPISDIDVVIQISKNRPMIARIGWKNGNGHAVVIKGYECKKMDELYIYINDPWPVKKGEEKVIKYTDFRYYAYGKNKGGQGNWTHTLANFKKKCF